MTAPIQEPSLYRTQSGQGWNISQLARRPAPAPSTAADLPWARISKGFDASNQTVNHNSFTDITFNHSYNMGVGESGNGVFTTSGTTGLKVLSAGLYQITAEMLWDDTVNATWAFGISSSPADGFSTHMVWGGPQSEIAGKIVVSYLSRLDINVILYHTVWQLTGGDRHVDASYLEAVRIGDWSGDSRTTMNPDE